MDNQPKIALAFDSTTMMSLFKASLEEDNYDIYEYTDGLKVIEGMCSVHPDVLVVYLDLPVINGFDISRIIKNTPSLIDINILIVASENKTVYKFWTQNSRCNGFFVATENNFTEFREEVKNLIPYMPIINKKNITPTHEELIEIITQGLNSDIYNLYIVNNAYSTSRTISDINSILMGLIKSLKTIFTYDALGLIVNDEPLIEFYDFKSSLTDSDIKDFRDVCHKDFESVAKNRKNCAWQKSIVFNTKFDVDKENGKLKTYEIFPLEPKAKVPFTLHLSTCRQDSLSDDLREHLNFFAHVFSQIISNAIQYHQLSNSNMRIRHAFGRFVPQQLIDSIVTGESSEDISIGQKRKVAILICDIRNFTNISEMNKPENVVTFLNRYFSVMGSIIKQNGGSIDKFMGDAIMALFGATDSFTDNEYRAVKTAYEMMKVLPGIDISMINFPDGFNFNIGIGIHYGDVIVGSIGSDEKQDFTVIGDNVNLASRIESLNKMYGTNIIVTEQVKESLHDNYKTRLLDRVKVKGKSIPVYIYQIITEGIAYPDDFMDLYNKGIDLYLMGIWKRASEYFNRALSIKSDDTATLLLMERCIEYDKNNPDDWDGSYTLTTK